MQPEKIDQYLQIYRDGLLNDTIPFWQKHAPDRKCGGFFNILDADGSVVGTDKPVWVMGRATWLYARLYNVVEQRSDWLALAKHGVDFLTRHCFDKDGRMFYSVTGEGKPLRKRRYLFSEAFGIIALAEYAKASGDEKYKSRAEELYRLLRHYHRRPGLLEPKLIPQTRQLKSHAMPMIILATTQVLRRLGDQPLYKEMINDALDQIERHFLKPKFKALLEAVGPNGEFLDEPMGRVINPGHAIETAWFIMEEARYRNDKKLIPLALKILDWSLDWGWDPKHGGILYFRDCRNKPCEQYEHDLKLWWPHNEAIYATLLAHFLTGKKKYEKWHDKIYKWAYAHFPDKKNGEWFGYLHRDGTISCPLKGNIWKGPFHLPRMQLNCWKLLEQVKNKEPLYSAGAGR